MIGIDTGSVIAFENKDHAEHAATVGAIQGLRRRGERIAICPQVIAEFIHVVTDPRRFASPLTMQQALDRGFAWQASTEICRIYPDDEAMRWFHLWMKQHQLGRKRVLDTMLAATYRAAGIDRLLTTNQGDFTIFDWFEFG